MKSSALQYASIERPVRGRQEAAETGGALNTWSSRLLTVFNVRRRTRGGGGVSLVVFATIFTCKWLVSSSSEMLPLWFLSIASKVSRSPTKSPGGMLYAHT